MNIRLIYCFFAIISALTWLKSPGASAAELVMFESDSCEWCQRWHAEIGVIYGKTAEAKMAPLRRVDVYDPVPADLSHLRAVHYTPTFVLMQDGEELGRIQGYPGEEFFWGLLAEEMGKLKSSEAAVIPEGAVTESECAQGSKREKNDEETGGRAAVC